MLRIACTSALLIAVALPAAAPAKVAKFDATFEASRTIEWNQPRGVSYKDCKGERWSEAYGSETWKLKTSKPQTLTIRGTGGAQTLWQAGTATAPGLEAAGIRERRANLSSGTSGGWCSPGLTVDPPRPDDCGTRLPRELVHFTHLNGEVWFTHSTAPWMAREKTEYDSCLLHAPSAMSEVEFPVAETKVSTKLLFDRTKKSIVLSGAKSYGPESRPVSGFHVDRTTSATVSWKLTLKRKK